MAARRNSLGVMLGLGLALAGWSVISGCSYDPHIKDGQLKCSEGEGRCPDGYECRANACFAATAGSSGTPDAGLGGDTIPAAVINRYLGNWEMDPGAFVVTHCNVSDDLGGTLEGTIAITAGIAGRSDLQSDWLCILGLRLDATGAHLTGASQSTCMGGTKDPTSTWTANRFDLVTTNGTTATHVANYTRVDKYLSGVVDTCSQVVTASLTKQ